MRAFLARSCVAAGLLWAVAGTAVQAAPFTALYSFGDSLSDVGNVFLATGGAMPGAPYANGRFSNGPTWVEDVSARLGLGSLTPSLAGGTDYAFGNATTGGSVPGAPAVVPNITQQVALFSAKTGGVAPSSALYTVWIGANDVTAALTDVVGGVLSYAQAVAALGNAAKAEAGAIGTLAAEGAETILVPLVPDLGKTPNAQVAPGLPAFATALSAAYNAALQAAIGGLTTTGDTAIHLLDTFALIDDAVANPASYGFTDVTNRCYLGPLSGGGTACATPNTYLFWDGQHPTAAGHAQIAALALSAIPEPSAAALLPVGVAILLGAVLARRRAPMR